MTPLALTAAVFVWTRAGGIIVIAGATDIAFRERQLEHERPRDA